MPKNSPTDAILDQLRASGGVAPGGVLRAAVPEISQPTFSRIIQGLRDRIIVLGRGRGATYALLRNVRGMGSTFPIHVVDEHGQIRRAATLLAVGSSQYWVEMEDGRGRLYDDIPFFIQDMRPQGFIGRSFGTRYPDLDLPVRINDWNQDHVMTALLMHGEDCPGNLVIGEASLKHFIAGQERGTAIPEAERASRYDAMATAAIDGQPVGSSAGGEQLKFTALLERSEAPQAVIVKFSPLLTSASGRRWADLLICEELALQFARAAGIPSSRAEVLVTAERAYLQVDRFDRIGANGRKGIVSLGALDDELFGERNTTYIEAADRLEHAGVVTHEECEQLRWIGIFGSLIANTDMHYGNVSLFFDLEMHYRLAPLYDMLPMLYAPQAEQIIAREFAPGVPSSTAASQWKSASHTAATYWNAVATDDRISAEFRAIAAENHAKVANIAARLATYQARPISATRSRKRLQ